MAIYVVLRTHRQSQRPLCWTEDRETADEVYDKEHAKMRDGSLALIELEDSGKQIRHEACGYMRTKW